MKIAIIGSRDIKEINIDVISLSADDELVSGGAVGVDACVAEYAKAHGIPLKEFYPDYKKYGRAAPIIRNKLIVDYADRVIAFWNGKSKGTKWVIDYCNKTGTPCEIVYHK